MRCLLPLFSVHVAPTLKLIGFECYYSPVLDYMTKGRLEILPILVTVSHHQIILLEFFKSEMWRDSIQTLSREAKVDCLMRMQQYFTPTTIVFGNSVLAIDVLIHQ